MQKHIYRAANSYVIRESGIDNNRYGWFDESRNSWVIIPNLTYSEAMSFNFTKYYKSIERFKKRLIKELLNDKKFKAKVKELNLEYIKQIKDSFNVNFLRDCCENYHPIYCDNVRDTTCINCQYRFNNFEKFEEKGGYNE